MVFWIYKDINKISIEIDNEITKKSLKSLC